MAEREGIEMSKIKRWKLTNNLEMENGAAL